ncbi:unnamed protein product [Lathyrus sativus]|nr:unnamed protein product [Lathyrus sativus]
MEGKCTSFIEELHTRFSSKHASTSVPVHLPEDVLAEILIRLPVKILVQCRFVCKSWAKLVTDPIFINKHLHLNSPTRIIFSDRQQVYPISISLPLNPNSNSVLNTQRLRPPLCPHAFQVKSYCNGLFIIIKDEGPIILWNPSISRHRVLPVPALPPSENHCSRRFLRDICAIGYDSLNDVYKIIVAPFSYGAWNVEVLSLNSNSWRKLPDAAEYPPYHVEYFRPHQQPLSINGAIYWIADDHFSDDHFPVIVRFDVCQERFSRVPPPWCDTRRGIYWIGDINHSLCTLNYDDESCTHIWSTQDDFNWVKLITFSKIVEPNPQSQTSFLYYAPLCFNENGELLISVRGAGCSFDRRRGLVVYDPKEQSYRRFLLEDNTHWMEETVYSDSLVFPNEPLDKTCSASSSGSFKQMMLNFSHTILSHLVCNATSRKRLL